MIENSIRAHAMNSAGLVALIGNRFHLTIKHNSKTDYVVVTVINDETPVEVQLEDNQSEATIQFDCFSTSPHTSKSIAKQIESIFHKKGFEDADIRVQYGIKQQRNPTLDTDTKLYRESIDYIFYYHNL